LYYEVDREKFDAYTVNTGHIGLTHDSNSHSHALRLLLQNIGNGDTNNPGLTPSQDQLSRRTIIGSTRPAIRAGRYEASTATRSTTAAVPAKTAGSVGLTS